MNRNEEIADRLRALANKATANGVAGIGTELSVEDTRLLHKAADKIAPLPTFASVDAAFGCQFGRGQAIPMEARSPRQVEGQ